MIKKENYLAGGGFAAILPTGDVSSIILALGGIIIVITAFLFILKVYRRKQSQDKFQKRFTGIKSQWEDLKEKGVLQEDVDWFKHE